MTTCDGCGKKARATRTTVTGRELCAPCHDQLDGLAAGAIATGGDAGGSIAVAGWFSRLRERRRR